MVPETSPQKSIPLLKPITNPSTAKFILPPTEVPKVKVGNNSQKTYLIPVTPVTLQQPNNGNFTVKAAASQQSASNSGILTVKNNNPSQQGLKF